MAMRQGVQPKGDAPSAGPPKAGRTGPLEAGDAMKLAHLALRNQAQRTNDPEGADASAAKVEAVVAQRMGTEGVKALRETFAAIQDAALPGKLQELSLRVNQLVPGVNTMDLGLDVGKRMVVNSLNPVLAITVGLAESAERIKKLQDWGNLTPQERLSNVANLTGNLAEILGALTPPPLNVGVQALGAGMALVGLASEHLEVGEVSKALGRHENVRRTANQMADGASSAASRVSEAWGELSDRLEASRLKRPKLPAPMQSLFGSPTWGKLKAWEATAPIAEGTENVAHNLSKSIERQVASVESSWQALKGKLGGGPPAPKAKVPGKGQKAKPKPGAEEVAAPSEIDQAAAQAEGPTP